jgi:hypothetical protein
MGSWSAAKMNTEIAKNCQLQLMILAACSLELEASCNKLQAAGFEWGLNGTGGGKVKSMGSWSAAKMNTEIAKSCQLQLMTLAAYSLELEA